MNITSMTMSLKADSPKALQTKSISLILTLTRINLMGSPQLMMTDDQILTDLLPSRSTEQMLSADMRITKEARRGHHC